MLGAVCIVGTSLFLRSPLVRSSSTSHGSGYERVPALASPELRALLGPVALMGVALGAVEVGLPSLALHAGSRPASGLLLALWSLGSMAGGALVRRARVALAARRRATSCCWSCSWSARRR